MELDKIYNEDCIEGMKRIPSDSINAIITDPPYCIGTTSNGKKGSYNDNNLIKPFLRYYLKNGFEYVKKVQNYISIRIGVHILFYIPFYKNIFRLKI